MKSSRKKLKESQREAALDIIRAWGRTGGKTRWAGVSAEERREHAKKAAAARWKKVQ